MSRIELDNSIATQMATVTKIDVPNRLNNPQADLFLTIFCIHLEAPWFSGNNNFIDPSDQIQMKGLKVPAMLRHHLGPGCPQQLWTMRLPVSGSKSEKRSL